MPALHHYASAAQKSSFGHRNGATNEEAEGEIWRRARSR